MVASTPGRQRAQPAPGAQQRARGCPADGFRRPRFDEYVGPGAAPAAPFPRSVQKKSDALSRPEILKLRPPKKNKFVDAPLNAQHRKKLPSKMSDYASLLATIADLQEQVNTMNGQLTEVRLSCPFP